MPSRSVPFQSDTFRYDTTRLFRPAATCWLCSGYSVAFWPPISGCLAVVGSRSQKEKRARVRLANPKDTAEMAPTLAGPGPPVLLLLPLAKLSPTDLCQRFLCQQPLARSPLELSHSLRLFLCLTIYLFISLSLAIYVISRALSLPFPRLHAHSLSHSLLPSLSLHLPLSLSGSLSISHFRLVNVSVSVFFYVAFGGRLFLACVCVCEERAVACCMLSVNNNELTTTFDTLAAHYCCCCCGCCNNLWPTAQLGTHSQQWPGPVLVSLRLAERAPSLSCHSGTRPIGNKCFAKVIQKK